MAKLHYQKPPTEKEKKDYAKFLAEDEELVLITGLGKIYLRSYFIIGIAWPGGIFLILGLIASYLLRVNLAWGLSFGLILACVVAFVKTSYTNHANKYLLTTRRVIIKKSIVAVKLTAALYDKITHIEVEQSFADKIFYQHGTIIINTAGTNKGEITLKYIDYPVEFKNLLERLINREREQYGFRAGHLETIEGEVV
ncbi:MAG: PH domain-containing protein [Candidatus Daviesbacteria bacterium]|nr:PH domain-containing protein [Candidatus Daviesbacteria bacterium]